MSLLQILHGTRFDPELLVEPIWIDIQAPSEQDMLLVAKHFHLHDLTAEDCTNFDTGEKWELFKRCVAKNCMVYTL